MLIKVDYYAMNKLLVEMINIAKEVQIEIEKMEETVENLGIFWNSDSSAEYAMRINVDLYSARAILETIRRSINSMILTAKTFDQTERSIREIIRDM